MSRQNILCCDIVWPNREVLCCNREFYVVIEDFYVSTELAMIESSSAHNRAGRVKAGAHNSVAPCYVATEKAMRA